MKTTFKKIALTLIVALSLPLGGSGWASAQANEPGAGNALSFDGNDIVNTNGLALLNTPNGTIECWIQWSGVISEGHFVIKTANPACCGSHFLTLLSSIPHVVQWSLYNSTYFRATGTTPLIPTEWYHIAATWGTGGMQIFINGVLEGTNTYTGTGANTTNPVSIGGWINFPQFFNGQIDEVRIWNTARSQTEIRNTMCSKLIGNEPGLVGYWRFDETAGNTYFDSQTNVAPNNGTEF